MDYAIVLYMNDESTEIVRRILSEVAPECGSDFCLRNVPHITISSIIADDEEAVRAEAEILSQKLRSGEIKVVSIGVFNPYVLYLAPVVDSYLIESSKIANDIMLQISEVGNQGRYTPYNWVPHIAIAMKMDREGLYKGFNKLSEIFTPFIAKIDKMALIKCEQDNPYQELVTYDL